MTTHQTQIDSLVAVKPTLPSKRQQVYDTILKSNGIASFQIAQQLGWLYHYITPRITELLDVGAIKDSGRTVLNQESNREVTIWVVTNPAIANAADFGEPNKTKTVKKPTNDQVLEKVKVLLPKLQKHFESLPDDLKNPLLHYDVNVLADKLTGENQ